MSAQSPDVVVQFDGRYLANLSYPRNGLDPWGSPSGTIYDTTALEGGYDWFKWKIAGSHAIPDEALIPGTTNLGFWIGYDIHAMSGGTHNGFFRISLDDFAEQAGRELASSTVVPAGSSGGVYRPEVEQVPGWGTVIAWGSPADYDTRTTLAAGNCTYSIHLTNTGGRPQGSDPNYVSVAGFGWVLAYDLPTPPGITAPPLRQFPRDDSLATGSAVRIWPPPSSEQGGVRRLGYF